jgi:hypothetical protein
LQRIIADWKRYNDYAEAIIEIKNIENVLSMESKANEVILRHNNFNRYQNYCNMQRLRKLEDEKIGLDKEIDLISKNPIPALNVEQVAQKQHENKFIIESNRLLQNNL